MIGIDIAEIARIAAALKKPAFVNGVFTAAEQAYCSGRPDPAQSHAGIFCAKEAAVKAVKSGFFGGVRPTDIEVTHADNGAPQLMFYGRAVELFAGYTVDVSISHDGLYAIAAVQLIKE